MPNYILEKLFNRNLLLIAFALGVYTFIWLKKPYCNEYTTSYLLFFELPGLFFLGVFLLQVSKKRSEGWYFASMITFMLIAFRFACYIAKASACW